MNGFLIANKPTGMTSSNLVVFVRRRLPKGTAIGHGGTLDPEASGVLPLCIGKATRLFDYIIDKKKTYVLTTENGVSNYMIAPCCHPIPGDDVVGYIDDDRHVVVHKLTCPNAMRLKSSFGGRLLSTKWDNRTEKFLASIHIEGIDRMGILQELIYIISTNMAINIRGLNIAANEGVFSCELTVLVEDTNVVTALCKQVKKVKGVNSAARMN